MPRSYLKAFESCCADDELGRLIAVESARRSHLRFMQHTWTKKSKMLVGYHTRVICQRIDRAFEDFRKGKSTYLAIKVPFRHGKSDMISRYLPAHFIGEFPEEEILTASYNAHLTYSFSRFCRQIVRSPAYREVYPEIELSLDERSVESWGIVRKSGHVYWTGLGGTITGKGGALIILDDFLKNREEAESEVMRENIWEAFSNDLMTRQAPTAIVIVLATPWHWDDIFGRIKDAMAADSAFPRFEDLRFPARSSDYPSGYLFPERFKPEWYEAQYATLGAYGAAGLLDCDPIRRGGGMFKTDRITFYDEPPSDLVWARGWDLASSSEQTIKEDPDYTVGAKVGVRFLPTAIPGERLLQIYLDDMERVREDATVRDPLIKSTAIKDGPITVGMEAFGAYKDAFMIVSKALNGIRKVVKIQLPGDKVSKWLPLELAINSGNFFMRRAPWNAAVLKELSEAPSGRHDDIMDGIIAGVEALRPSTSQVLPPLDLGDEGHVSAFTLSWDKKRVPRHTCLHYGAMSLTEDLELHVMGGVWDEQDGDLYIYFEYITRDLAPDKIAYDLTKAMHLRDFWFERFLVNPRMLDDQGKNLAALLAKEFQKFASQQYIRLREPKAFDCYGALSLASRMIARDRLHLHATAAKDTIQQLSTWRLENDKLVYSGQRENLLLLCSELERTAKSLSIVEESGYQYAGHANFRPNG